MDSSAFGRAARILVERCAGIEKNNEVLIVTDSQFSQSIPDAIFNAAYSLGAEAVIFKISSREAEGTNRTSSMLGELPKSLEPSILASDVLFICTTKRPNASFLSIREKLVKKGGKVLNFYLFTEDMFARTIAVDYDTLSRRVSTITKMLPRTEKATLTSPTGTNISFSLKNRPIGLQGDGVAQPGESEPFPAGIVDITPEEGTANGTLVYDGTQSYFYDLVTEGLGHIIEPIVCEIKNGRVTEVTGGAQAKRLKAKMKASDANASSFSEMFIGFNPAAQPNSGLLTEDERSAGVIGFGLGRNTHMMGKVDSNFHFDGTVLHGSLALDGQTVIEDGKFKI